MPFVDPERFKRFERFISRHAGAFAAAADSGFSSRGRGAVVYSALDDRFEGTLASLPLQYKTQSEIDTAHGQARDELLQGLLERYQPPGEAVFVAVYHDQTYDITRVTMQRSPQPPPSQAK